MWLNDKKNIPIFKISFKHFSFTDIIENTHFFLAFVFDNVIKGGKMFLESVILVTLGKSQI